MIGAQVFGWFRLSGLNPPTGLNATTASSTQIDLVWVNTQPVSTRIYRGGVLLTTVGIGVTTYSNTGLTPSTLYSYTVRHYDTTESADSNTDSDTTSAGGPDGPPSGLAVTSRTTTQIAFSWTNGDAGAQTSFEKDSVESSLRSAGVTTYTQTGLTANTSYAFRIRHLEAAIYSGYNGPITAYTNPNVPTSLNAVTASSTQIDLTWTNAHSLDTRIYRDGVLLTSVSSGVTSYSDTGLTPSTLYSYTLRHYNATSGLESADSTGDSDTTSGSGPSGAPSAIDVDADGNYQFGITVTLTDTSAETEVYRNGVLITTLAAGVAYYAHVGRTSGVSNTYKARHKKSGLFSSYTADNTKTYPGISSLSVTPNDFDDKLTFAYTNTGDLPTGWYFSITWQDDLAYLTPQVVSNAGQTTTYDVSVIADYDVDAGGTDSPTVTWTASLKNSGGTVLATETGTPSTFNVTYSP